MAPERLYAGACGDLPDLDGMIIGPQSKPAAIRRDGYRWDPIAMAFQCPYADAYGDLPDLDGIMVGPGRKPAAIRRDGYRKDQSAIALEGLYTGTPSTFYNQIFNNPRWYFFWFPCRIILLFWSKKDKQSNRVGVGG